MRNIISILGVQQSWAEVIDFLTMYLDARRQVVRVLGEMSVRGEG
jgi:hypothetical protein